METTKKECYLTIKKGSMEFVKAKLSDLIDVQPSGDGIVFNFKNGFSIYYTDGFMPNSSKDLIFNSTNKILNMHLDIDLSNYKTPIKARV